MSLPGIFDPAMINGRVLLDGGLVNQVPIDVVRGMGAEVVIAVDVGTPLATLDGSASLLAVLGQMTSMMTVGNTRAQLRTLGERDVLVVPELGTEVTSADFDKGELALQIGDRAVAAVQDRLDALGAAGPGGTLALAAKPAAGPPVIDFLRLDNTTAYDDAVFLTRIDVPLGEPLDADALEAQLQGIFGMETFALVAYELVEEEGRTGVVVRARPKAFGPNYLQAGLRLNSDFEGSFGADLRVGVLFAPISRYGAEARVVAQVGSEPALAGEVYIPFDPRNRNAVASRVAIENIDINVFDADGNNVAKYEANSGGIEVGWVREFGNVGAATVGDAPRDRQRVGGDRRSRPCRISTSTPARPWPRLPSTGWTTCFSRERAITRDSAMWPRATRWARTPTSSRPTSTWSGPPASAATASRAACATTRPSTAPRRCRASIAWAGVPAWSASGRMS